MKKSAKIIAFIAIVLFFIAILSIDLITIKGEAKDLKASIKTGVSYIKEDNTDDASEAFKAAEDSSNRIINKLDTPLWKLVSKIPKIGKNVDSAKNLCEVYIETYESVITPGLNQLKKYPLSSIKTDNGLCVSTMVSYIDFLESISDDLINSSAKLKNISPWFAKEFGVDKYLDTFESVIDTYDSASKYIPLVRAFLGTGEDKVYVFTAQNSAEIRASGGFPGSVGIIRIKDDELIIEDFQSVSYVLPHRMPASCNVTAEENALFDGWLTLQRDACYIPDFERVGFMWADGYRVMHDEEVDGVISAVPAVVQKMLSFLGSVTLSDGRTIDGTNAVKVIEKDIYYDYFKFSNYTSKSNEITDALFSEAAKKTFELATSSFSLEYVDEYFDMFKGCFDNREIMVYMSDPDTQELVRELGCSGALNFDENAPEAGVFFSCYDPGRLGLYISIDTEIGKPVKNKDGSCTYDITVTLNNSIEDEIIHTAKSYIVGNNNGAISSYLHLFAPKGGTISDFVADNDMSFSKTVYKDLEVGYAKHFFVYPHTPIKISYKVTTAPGVDTPLKITSTPTLQDYIK